MTGWAVVPSVGILVLATLAAIGALYVGREFCIPIALALLLNALLRPLVRGLERLRVPPAAGAALVVLGLLGGLAAGGFAVAEPVRLWVGQVPASLETAARKLETARHALEQVSQTTQAVTDPGGTPPAAPAAPAVPPALAQLFGTTATLVAGLAGVLLLLYLLLASGDLFLRKLVEVLSLFGDKRTAVRVAEAVQRAVTRYLGATLLINLGQGLAVGLALWALGMPHLWLWGGLTVALEFIPYLGAAGMIGLLAVQTWPRPTLLVKSKSRGQAVLHRTFEGPQDYIHSASDPHSHSVGD